ncbi:MAG: DUF1992 domain-containing protein [Spirochaetes bacterium]|nr:DUF1992 domain-containing protein [Spirochaetota bacterium]
MYIFEIIAERRIREAMEQGVFDNNPLQGKPLPRDCMDNVAPELRIAYKILKNANIIPEELELRKRINRIDELLCICESDYEKAALQRELSDKTLRYNLIMERRLGRPLDQRYAGKVLQRFRR